MDQERTKAAVVILRLAPGEVLCEGSICIGMKETERSFTMARVFMSFRRSAFGVDKFQTVIVVFTRSAEDSVFFVSI